jgi:hypothetical protein
MKYNYYEYEEEEYLYEEKPSAAAPVITFGCKFCWDDRKKQDKKLMFFDQANNLRDCNYCPWCGRAYNG